MRRKWGGALPVTDNVSRRKHGEVRKYPGERNGTEIPPLPAETPRLGAVESVWKDARYGLVTSERHETPVT